MDRRSLEDYLHWGRRMILKSFKGSTTSSKTLRETRLRGLASLSPLNMHYRDGGRGVSPASIGLSTVLRGTRPPRFWKLHNAAIIKAVTLGG